MKKFFFGVMRLEVLLGLGALIGAALSAATEVLATVAGRWLGAVDAQALQWTAGVVVLTAAGAIAWAIWQRVQAGRGLASE